MNSTDGHRSALRPKQRDWLRRSAHWNLIASMAAPLLLAALLVRKMRRRSPVVGLREKCSGAAADHSQDVSNGQILMHGVSLGEVNLMRPLVPRLEQRLAATCLLSTTTQTGREQLDKLFPQHQRVFFPFDLPWAVRALLTRSRPRLVVLLEFEVWPLFLCACFARGIPVVVINAKISERSFQRFRQCAAATRPLFAGLSLVLAQNGAWAARLRALGVRPQALRVCGSLKADTVACAPAGAAEAAGVRFGLRPGQPVLLLASTSACAGAGGEHGEEGVVLGGSTSAWQERGWQVVICPRHPERGLALAEQVRLAGGIPRRTSVGEAVQGAGQVLIVDQIGQLAALYAWTAAVQGIAVVGGSLGSRRGGQNMLEAAAHGCCTVVGMDTRNFPDAMALLRKQQAVVEVADGALAQVLAVLAGDAIRRSMLGERAKCVWQQSRGAIDRVVEAVAQRFA